MKTAFVLAFSCLILASCSLPSFLAKKEANVCACDDGSGKYGPKGEKCGEKLKEKIGKQGYYGELEISKSPAYFSKDCRTE